MKIMLKDKDICKIEAFLRLYKNAADAFHEKTELFIEEMACIRKILSNEMDYLIKNHKDNEVAKREVQLFNEIIGKMIRADKKGDEILHAYGFEDEFGEIDSTEG